MNFRLFLAVEWGRRVGGEIGACEVGWWQWERSQKGVTQAGLVATVASFCTYKGQRSSSPGGCKNILNWEGFIHQSFSSFGNF